MSEVIKWLLIACASFITAPVFGTMPAVLLAAVCWGAGVSPDDSNPICAVVLKVGMAAWTFVVGPIVLSDICDDVEG